MKVATWNVNGIRAREEQFLSWIASEAPDVVCLQETKASASQLSLSLKSMPDYYTCWHGAGGYSGVSLQFRRATFPDPPEFSHPSFDRESRIVQATAHGVTFASVYVPNGGKDFIAKVAFLEAMEAYVGQAHARGETLVLCGDMNITRTSADVHPSQRDESLIGQRPDERALFERILARGLVDIGRALSPSDERLFTWWPYWKTARPRNLGWRLDYILASPKLAAVATSCAVSRKVGTSDHAPVIAEIRPPGE